MAKQTPSSDPFGLEKMWSGFDPTKLMGEFAKAFDGYKSAGVDVTGILDSQRKNVEALSAANKVALEGIQTVAARQREILQQTMDNATTALKDLTAASSPQAATAAQAELLKSAFDKALSNMRELAETMTKANTEAVEIVNRRMADSLKELKDLAGKGGGK